MPNLVALTAVLVALPTLAAADPGHAGPPGAYEPPATQPSAYPPPTPAADAADPCDYHALHARAGTRRRGFIGVGFAKSHVELDNDSDASQKSLLVRAQGKRGFGVELEFARMRLDGADDVTRTAGVSLFKAFGRRKLMPYVIVGAGGGEDVRYREAGGGLMVKKRRFAFGVDVRRGVRRAEHAVAPPEGMVAPAMISTPDDTDRERYTRARILALVTF